MALALNNPRRLIYDIKQRNQMKPIVMIFKQIDGTITGSATPSQSEPRSNGDEGVVHIFKSLELEFHYQMQFNVISKAPHFWRRGERVVVLPLGVFYV